MKSILTATLSVFCLIAAGLKHVKAENGNTGYFLTLPADTIDTLKVGQATIIQSHSITTLVKKHIAHNEAQKTIDGYRIEIYSGSGNEGKTGAGKTRTAFLTAYPGYGAYLSYTQPNYAIRVGDFKEHIDAIRFLHKIQDDFPDAMVVKEKVMK